jgi:hypothetical protein
MLAHVFVRTTDRIPGFAICARCGARQLLAPCPACGILVCGDCRGVRECAVCRGERLAAVEQERRRARRREVARRAAVVAMVAASGVTGLSAAFIPAGPICSTAIAPVAVEVRVGPREPDHTLAMPLPLEPAAPSWTQPHTQAKGPERPLTFTCFQARRNLTCCVVELR